MIPTRILFIGESWQGSCARSFKDALARHPAVQLDEVSEDHFLPRHRALWVRAINRFLHEAYRQELYRQILSRVRLCKPDVVMTYKGQHIDIGLIKTLKALGCVVVNVYPDYSPHAYGAGHRMAMGEYDLVVSTKPFHPDLWRSVYGYSNPCIFVPQGYDPALHLVSEAPSSQSLDIIMVATWRSEYGVLMERLGSIVTGRGMSVGIGGNGWLQRRKDYPSEWVFPGELHGRAYVEWLRRGRICVAPANREVVVNGMRQPGDEDTTRTYELPAAHCFFIHRRTEFVRRLFDETTEVPMYDTPEELAEKILHFLPRLNERERMAAAAHRRAVPAYSLDSRANDVLAALRDFLGQPAVGH